MRRAFCGNKINQKALSLCLAPSRLSPQSCIFPSLDIISLFCPQLARRYPNMNLEFQGAVVSAPFLNFSPGNLSLAPQMEIEASVILPSSIREPVFRLGVVRFKGFANAAPFSCVLPPPAANSFRSLKCHFLKGAFLDCSYPDLP